VGRTGTDGGAPKQVLAGISSGADGPGVGSEIKTQLERALAEAAAGGQLGEAFLQLNRMLANEPDKAGTLRLIARWRSRIPTWPRRISPSRWPPTTRVTPMSPRSIAMQAADRALELKPGWEPGVLLKSEILAKQSPEQAASYLVDFLKTEPESKAGLSALAQVRIQQKRYAEALAILERLWQQDRSNREYQFGMAMLAIQMKDWRRPKLCSRSSSAPITATTHRGVLSRADREETGRHELALERFRASRRRAGVDCETACSDRARQARARRRARRYLADLPA